MSTQGNINTSKANENLFVDALNASPIKTDDLKRY